VNSWTLVVRGAACASLNASRQILCVSVLVLGPACVADSPAQPKTEWVQSWRKSNPTWRGVHLMVRSDEQANQVAEILPRLAPIGVNVLVLEVNYDFDFQSHPELRSSQFIKKATAQKLAVAAHAQGIRLIPQFNCLGHQSWAKVTFPLLSKYPQLDETPGKFPENKDIYCRSWCPQNPEVNQIIFPLIDELIDAFEADAVHVGMDEVFLIASDYCPRCRGGDPTKLFAKAVNDLHRHIVNERHLEMLMWGDRLLDAKALGYSEWEASKNGTFGALGLIDKDIIICDWHYEKQNRYPSLPIFVEKGVRVWPSGWQPLESTRAFSEFARSQTNALIVGYLCTTWGKVKTPDVPDWPPITEILSEWKTRELH